MRTLLVIPMVFSLAACGGEDEGSTAPLTNADFASELNVDLSAMMRTASGLYLQDLLVGSGDEAVAGTTVSVHYAGWLPNGTKFDSSRDRNDPFVFQLGAGLVIGGWDEGVVGMRIGGMRKLVIPPHLGYGAAGAGSAIPGNATLVFDIELLSVTP